MNGLPLICNFNPILTKFSSGAKLREAVLIAATPYLVYQAPGPLAVTTRCLTRISWRVLTTVAAVSTSCPDLATRTQSTGPVTARVAVCLSIWASWRTTGRVDLLLLHGYRGDFTLLLLQAYRGDLTLL